MRKIAIRPRAQLDIESAYMYLAIECASPQAADDLITAFYDEIERLSDFPESGKRIENDALSRPYRRVLCQSYWMYYYYDKASITIFRVFHTSRDIDEYAITDF